MAARSHRAVIAMHGSTGSAFGFVVGLLVLLALIPPSVGLAAEPAAWELRAYRISVRVATDRSPLWTEQRLSRLRQSIESQCEDMIGKRWNITLAEADAAWARASQRETSLDAKAETTGVDKTIVVRLQLDAGAIAVTAREWDHDVAAWGPATTRRAKTPDDVSAAAAGAILAAFSQVAAIIGVDEQQVIIRGRAVGLPSRLPTLTGFPVGTALRLRAAPEAAGDPSAKMPWTYLVVEANDGDEARCRVVSRFGNALEELRRSPRSWLALKVGATGRSTRLRLHAADGKTPLANAEVLARGLRAKDVEIVGRTDDRGIIEISGGGEALRLLAIRRGRELAARLPVTPGWPRELQVAIGASTTASQEDVWLESCRTELVELLLRRQIMLGRVKSRAVGNKKDAESMLARFRAAEKDNVEALRQRIDGYRDQTSSRDKDAWNRLTAIVKEGFDASPLDQLAASLRPPPPKPPPQPAKPAMPAGWKTFVSSTGGFQTAMPPSPKTQQLTVNLPNGAAMATFVSVESGELYYVAMHYDLPVDGQRSVELALTQARDAFARNYQATFSEQSAITLDGKKAMQLVGTTSNRALRSRIVNVGTRIYQVLVMGEQAKLSSANAKFFLESLKVAASADAAK